MVKFKVKPGHTLSVNTNMKSYMESPAAPSDLPSSNIERSGSKALRVSAVKVSNCSSQKGMTLKHIYNTAERRNYGHQRDCAKFALNFDVVLLPGSFPCPA